MSHLTDLPIYELMSQLILDAGAYIAFERGDVRVRARLAAARRLAMDIVTTSPVVAQVWRDGRRQALLARLLAATHVSAPDEVAARRAGEVLARTLDNSKLDSSCQVSGLASELRGRGLPRPVRTGADDVVDALLVGLARDGDTVMSGDPDDIARLLAAAAVRAAVATV